MEEYPVLQCKSMQNDHTTAIQRKDLTKIISLSNHYPRVLEFDRNIENDPVMNLLKKDSEASNIAMN